MTRNSAMAIDLIALLALPWGILSLASGDDMLGPRWAPAVAMIPPLLHAVWRRFAKGKASPLTGLVVASLLVNALLGFVTLDARWFAVKEAGVPLAMGAVTAITTLRGPGLVAAMLDELLDPSRFAAAMSGRPQDALDARTRRSTLAFAGVFVANGVVSAAVATWLVTATSGTTAFAEQLGSYTSWSFLLVNLPTMVATVGVLKGVLTAVETVTGRPIDELLPT